MVPWGVKLSHYDLKTRKVQRDEAGLAAILGAGIAPREHLDEVAESLIPAKGRIKAPPVKAPPVMSIEMLEADYSGWVMSFDGVAKTSSRKGSCGCILWRLPEWNVLDARGFILNDVTVNDAEYYSLLKGLIMAIEHDILVVGDSRIVIQQVQGLINCHQPNLQRRLAEYEVLKENFRMLKLVHVKRDFNQAADYLTSKTLVLDKSWIVQEPDEQRHLEVVSKIHERLMKPPLVTQQAGDGGTEDPNDTLRNDPDEAMPGLEYDPLPPAARVMAVLIRHAAEEALEERPAMGPLEYQAERWRRIKVHQDQEDYIVELKAFLKGDLDRFSPRRLRKVAKVADLYVLDGRDVLYRLARSTPRSPS
ncbi:unnamed protein product [Phytophthora fragariaefolia]|uniref:Unnamed protein product n=1 Tax=Phytophthora fragariaefolia TaxID=1490495 RepID=A0A9W6XEZ4_9STRA|nr:unnamed protein product [Phytophthora fragariaefolia]